MDMEGMVGKDGTETEGRDGESEIEGCKVVNVILCWSVHQHRCKGLVDGIVHSDDNSVRSRQMSARDLGEDRTKFRPIERIGHDGLVVRVPRFFDRCHRKTATSRYHVCSCTSPI